MRTILGLLINITPPSLIKPVKFVKVELVKEEKEILPSISKIPGEKTPKKKITINKN
jgi:hypothetical protein